MTLGSIFRRELCELTSKARLQISEIPMMHLWRFRIKRNDENESETGDETAMLIRFTIGVEIDDAKRRAENRARAENAFIAPDTPFERLKPITLQKLQSMLGGFSPETVRNSPIPLTEILELAQFEVSTSDQLIIDQQKTLITDTANLCDRYLDFIIDQQRANFQSTANHQLSQREEILRFYDHGH